MAATSTTPTFSTFTPTKPHHNSIIVLSFLPKSPLTPHHRSLPLQISSSSSPKPPNATPIHAPQILTPRTDPTNTQHFLSRFAPGEQRKGSDVLVEALEREGVRHVFAFPGGAILDIHQALTSSNTIRNVLPRHEQGGVFAAEGYARASGEVGVCIATSGPGATNLVSGLADAMLDSVPLVAITGQVPRPMIGAAVARPDAMIVDIDGDGSFMMNVQELATIRVENLPVKIMLLNNQHLGMVVQWEDRFYKANRAHTYLGNPENIEAIFPDMLKFAEACDIPSARVTKLANLRNAIQTMLDTPGPYLLDVIVPHQEQVLPMIPSGAAFKDTINK